MTPAERDASERDYFAWRQRQRDLADLIEHWGEAYDIGWHPGSTGGWHAGRKDDGTVLRYRTSQDLHDAIMADYTERPVPRDGYATASHEDPDDLQRDGIDPR